MADGSGSSLSWHNEIFFVKKRHFVLCIQKPSEAEFGSMSLWYARIRIRLRPLPNPVPVNNIKYQISRINKTICDYLSELHSVFGPKLLMRGMKSILKDLLPPYQGNYAWFSQCYRTDKKCLHSSSLSTILIRKIGRGIAIAKLNCWQIASPR